MSKTDGCEAVLLVVVIHAAGCTKTNWQSRAHMQMADPEPAPQLPNKGRAKYAACRARCRNALSVQERRVVLEGMRLGPKAVPLLVKHLSAPLAANFTHVRALLLADNRLGDRGTAALGAALAYNCTITHLDVRRNSVTPAGIAALRRTLSTNVTLLRLEDDQSRPNDLNEVFTNVQFHGRAAAAAVAAAPAAAENNNSAPPFTEQNVLFMRLLTNTASTLDFSHRRWADDNDTLAQLHTGLRVQCINLAHNRIAKLPPASLYAVGATLRELVLENNGTLCELPPSIRACTNLRVLRLAGNALQRLPSELVYCAASLQALDVSRNRALEALPPNLVQRSVRLRSLSVRHCPMLTARWPPSVSYAGDAMLIAWLRNAERSPVTLTASPLLIVGAAPRAGTSSLVAALRGQSLASSTGSNTLSNVSLSTSSGGSSSSSSSSGNDGNSAVLPIVPWDCGGGTYWLWDVSAAQQPLLDALYMHQRSAAPYTAASIVVARLTDAAAAANIRATLAWLAALHAHAADAPGVRRAATPHVLLALTFVGSGEGAAEAAAELLEALGPETPLPVAGAVLVDVSVQQQHLRRSGNAAAATTTPRGISELRTQLAGAIASGGRHLPWATHSLPAALALIARRVYDERQRMPPVVRVARELADWAQVSPQDAHALAACLHAAGQCVYLLPSDGGGDAASSGVLIADPSWACALVDETLRAVRNVQPQWTHAELDAVLLTKVPSAARSKSARDHLLLLGVCVASVLPQQQRVRIAIFPDALPDAPPCGERALAESWAAFPPHMCTRRRYHLPNAPRRFFQCVLARLINRCRDGVAADLRPLHFWRRGIALTTGNDGIALLSYEAGPTAPVLDLRIAVGELAAYTRALHEALSALCTEWLCVNARVTLACPSCGAADGFELIQAETEALVRRQPTAPCAHCAVAVPLTELLPDTAELIQMIAAPSAASTTTMIASPRALQTLLPVVSPCDLHIVGELGTGSFATVYKAIYEVNNGDAAVAADDTTMKKKRRRTAGGGSGFRIDALQTIVAVKRLLVQHDTDQRTLLLDFVREAWIMAQTAHPNLVGFIGVCSEPLQMVVEYMNGGSLYDYLQAPRPDGTAFLPIDEQRQLALDVARGLQHLHGGAGSVPIVHRDVKSLNVLLERDESTGTLRAAVADFGLSRSTLMTQAMRVSPVENPRWSAPEIVERQPYTEKADVYAFGIVLCEIATRALPFGDLRNMQIEQAIVAGQRPIISDAARRAAAPGLLELAARCWQQNPAQRPSMAQCVHALVHGSAAGIEFR